VKRKEKKEWVKWEWCHEMTGGRRKEKRKERKRGGGGGLYVGERGERCKISKMPFLI
jgi:hypothetical protein